MIDPQEIESFLHGNDPEEHIVAIEYDYATESVYKIKEIPGKGKEIKKDLEKLLKSPPPFPDISSFVELQK